MGTEGKKEKNKVVAIYALMAITIAIVLLGVALVISSVINGTNFAILNAKIHGAAFGMVIIFVGVRYFLSVFKLKTEVYKTSSQFSWSNFKKAKEQKSQ